MPALEVEEGRPFHSKGEGKSTSAKGSKSETLFTRLGGVKSVKALVEEMYTRLLDDPHTKSFFDPATIAHLKLHQLEFMKIAFSQIPEDLDVPGLLVEKHLRLFQRRGLNETHFDKVAEHFVGACHHMQVNQTLIDEAVGIIGPLRIIFEEKAKEIANQKAFTEEPTA